MPILLTGLEVLLRDGIRLPGSARVGLLCNAATTDRRFRSTPELLHGRTDLVLSRIFSPQHGFAAEKQDNMIESGDGVHTGTGVPMFSLYGRVREPEPGMLDGLDAILIDVVDVGTRVYTFLSTAFLLMRQAARAGIPVVILDRPNPIGSLVEGPVLEEAFSSFVGLLPVPLRHGLTVGEYCRFGASLAKLDLELRVVAMEGHRRDRWLDETGLPWLMPSPNMPTLDTATVYPGAVMLEGVNLSEGRGTTRPFELFGAPWLDPSGVLRFFEPEWVAVEGVRPDAPRDAFLLREVAFRPTFHKFAGETTRGFQLHVLDRRRFLPVTTFLAIIASCLQRHPEAFAWREPPYEYEHHRLPFDLIAGTDRVRRGLMEGRKVAEIVCTWEDARRSYLEERRPHLLYD